MLNTPIGRLRAVGLIEGLSFLILLGIAMPLKYAFGQPLAVKIVGWTHGVLFMAFCSFLWQAMDAANWSPRQASRYLIAALVPFGPFLVDRRLREEEANLRR